jgi:hypothetical protein
MWRSKDRAFLASSRSVLNAARHFLALSRAAKSKTAVDMARNIVRCTGRPSHQLKHRLFNCERSQNGLLPYCCPTADNGWEEAVSAVLRSQERPNKLGQFTTARYENGRLFPNFKTGASNQCESLILDTSGLCESGLAGGLSWISNDPTEPMTGNPHVHWRNLSAVPACAAQYPCAARNCYGF